MDKKKKYTNDHDLLVALDTKISILVEDIKRMNDSTKNRLADHESRIRAVEDEHLQYGPSRQVERINTLENKVGSFWRVVGFASGIGAAVGLVGGFLLQLGGV